MSTQYIGREQTIVHFETINQVDESKFQGSSDPIIVYRVNGAQVQVNVTPFNDNNSELESLNFGQKMAYYKRVTRHLKTNVVLLEEARDEVVTAITTAILGNYDEFLTSFNNPADTGMTLAEYFGSTFLELNPEELTNLQDGLDNHTTIITDIKQEVGEF